ncbi:MAG: hypothetical protein AAB367_03495 [Patescibacteria group bacterium]
MIQKQFSDVIWCTPPQTFHITLLDWIAPLVDYGREKEQVFQEIFLSYDKALQDILAKEKPFTIDFSEIRVSEGAIILFGHDNGTFQRMRKAFTDVITLIPGTKPPAQIVHSTVCRYQKEVDLSPIQEFVAKQQIQIIQPINEFRLIHETTVPMLEFEVVKIYKVAK